MGQLLFVAGSEGGGAVVTDLYIATTGNDANDGATPATAVATFDRIWELLPGFFGETVYTVHIGNGTHTLTTPPQFDYGSGALILIGDGAGQGADDGTTTIATETLVSYTSLTARLPQLEVAGPLPVDSLQGYSLEMLDGPAIGQRKSIAYNTATLYETLSPFTAAPAPGNTFRVFASAVTLISTTGVAFVDARIGFVNVNVSDGSAFRAFSFTRGELAAFGVRAGIGFSSFTLIDGVDASAGYTAAQLANSPSGFGRFIADGAGQPSSDAWRGWGGVSFQAGVGTFTGFLGQTTGIGVSSFAGYLVDRVTLLTGITGRIDGIRSESFNVTFGSASVTTMKLAHRFSSGVQAGGFVDFGAQTGNSFVDIVPSNSGSSGSVLVATLGGVIRFFAGTVTGSYSAGYLLEADGGGVFQFSARTRTNVITVNPTALAGSTGAIRLSAGVLEMLGVNTTIDMSLNAGPGILAEGNSTVDIARATLVRFSTPAGPVASINESTLSQYEGVLNLTATAGNAIQARNSRVKLRGGANTVVSAGADGVRATAGANVWFDTAPSSVLGGAGADLGVDGAAAVANANLAAANDFLVGATGVGASPGTSGGSVIGRVA